MDSICPGAGQIVTKREINSILEQLSVTLGLTDGMSIMDYCKSTPALKRLMVKAPPDVMFYFWGHLQIVKNGLKGGNYLDGLKHGMTATTAEKAEALAGAAIKAETVTRRAGL